MTVHVVFQEATLRNYKSLRLRPEQFTSYLTDSVGFSSYRLLRHSGERHLLHLLHLVDELVLIQEEKLVRDGC